MSVGADNTVGRPLIELPLGNVGFGDGRILIWDRKDSLHMADLRAQEGMPGETRVWRTMELHALLVIGSIDYTPRWGPLLHISFSYHRRWPDWTEIKHLKRAFFGDRIGVSMHLPAEEYYVNLHPNTFHLWQDPETWDLQ